MYNMTFIIMNCESHVAGVCIIITGVHYQECATHIVVVQSSFSRFDVTE